MLPSKSGMGMHVKSQNHIARVEVDALFRFSLEELLLPELPSRLNREAEISRLNSDLLPFTYRADLLVRFPFTFALWALKIQSLALPVDLDFPLEAA